MRTTIVTLMIVGAITAQLAYAQHQHGTVESQNAPLSAGAEPFARQMETGMEKMMNDMHSPGYTGKP
jgi:hypothetical protein